MATQEPTPDSGCGGCLGLIGIAFIAIIIIGVFVDVPEEPTHTTPFVTETAISPTRDSAPLLAEDADPCIEAFARAADVSEYSDTPEDLFPAYSACASIDAWKEAYALHPAAIDGGNPVEYATTVCASNQEALGRTSICKAVNAAPATRSSLRASGRTGLLGAPLPAGARLTERVPGNPAEYTDPSETYAISASADDITAFFNKEMSKAGWYKSASGLFLGFEKGSLVLGIYISNNKFTLMGS